VTVDDRFAKWQEKFTAVAQECDQLSRALTDLKGELHKIKQALGANTRHMIQLDNRGWTILHPLSCRPNLFDCPVNFAARETPELELLAWGRYYCVNDGDELIIQEPVESDETS
jgi:hypothetical protein